MPILNFFKISCKRGKVHYNSAQAILIPSLFGQTGGFCTDVFKDYEIYDAFNCIEVTGISGLSAAQESGELTES